MRPPQCHQIKALKKADVSGTYLSFLPRDATGLCLEPCDQSFMELPAHVMVSVFYGKKSDLGKETCHWDTETPGFKSRLTSPTYC